MVYVAKQMQEQGFNLPLLIGGATTQKAHTAVKNQPNYQNDAVVYVADASRAVGVATTLLSKENASILSVNCVKIMAKSVNAANPANPKRRSCRMPNRLNKASNTTGRTTRRLSPTNWDKSFWTIIRYKFIALISTGHLSLSLGDWSENIPKSLTIASRREEAKDLFANAQAMIDKLIKGKIGHSQNGVSTELYPTPKLRHGAGTG